MKRILVITSVVLLAVGIAYGATKTILQLTAETAPTTDDLVHVWEVGAAASRKVTLTNLTKGLRDASATDKGVASFDSNNFTVTSGDVKLALGATPPFRLAINAPTTADDLVIGYTTQAITITDIRGILQAGTNVVGGLYYVDADGVSNLTAVDSDITFDGGLDEDDGSLTNPTVAANKWIKWYTTSVSSPGYWFVQADYTID